MEKRWGPFAFRALPLTTKCPLKGKRSQMPPLIFLTKWDFHPRRPGFVRLYDSITFASRPCPGSTAVDETAPVSMLRSSGSVGNLDAHHRHQVGMIENKQQEWVSLGHRECERSAGCPRKHWVLGLEFWRAHSASDRALRNSNILMDLSLNMLV